MRRSAASVLRGIVRQAIGLVVDDGFIAVGAVAALVLTATLAWASVEVIPRDALGVVLFAIVAVVLFVSLVRAGRAAQAQAVETPIAERLN
jgi:hypothetical protein